MPTEQSLISNILFSDDGKLGHVDSTCSFRQCSLKKKISCILFVVRDRLCGSPRCHERLLSDNSNYFWSGDCCSSTETLHTVVSKTNRKSLQLSSFLLLLLICSWEKKIQKGNRNRKCRPTLIIRTGGRAVVCFHYCGKFQSFRWVSLDTG